LSNVANVIAANLYDEFGGTAQPVFLVSNVNAPEMQAAAKPYWPGYSSHGTGTDRPHVASADLDSGNPYIRLICGNQVGGPAAQRFSENDRSAAMQNAKRLLRALINRHLTTDKIRTHRRNPDTQNPLNTVLHPVIHLVQAHRSLADVFIQAIANVEKEIRASLPQRHIIRENVRPHVEKNVKLFEVTIAGNGKTFQVREGENILVAALRQGVMLPYSCKNGTCGSCKGQLQSGEVHYPFHPPLALEKSDFAEDFALLCQAEPVTDLVIKVREIEAVRDIQIRMLPARVLEKTLLAENVVRLQLRLPAGQRLQFLAGQYVDVLLSGGKRRAFSIASCPSLENEIELHIRHVEGGDFTGYVFNELQERDILRLEGPQGNFFVRNDCLERPMIMMGGGTGFAPLKSMIENLIEQDDRRRIHLYWGARVFPELYLDALPTKWAKDHDHIHYRKAIQEPGAGASGRFFTGFVHEAVISDHADLSGFDVYMSGPPAMIEAAKRQFMERGVPEDRLFYDSFEFGLDVPVRVLARPH
jgi:CDP-4-dehydro-6-deoxyglucose reductase